jgi:hypothetical protein
VLVTTRDRARDQQWKRNPSQVVGSRREIALLFIGTRFLSFLVNASQKHIEKVPWFERVYPQLHRMYNTQAQHMIKPFLPITSILIVGSNAGSLHWKFLKGMNGVRSAEINLDASSSCQDRTVVFQELFPIMTIRFECSWRADFGAFWVCGLVY